MYLGQYDTRYSPLAAGAILSLLVSVGPLIIGLIVFEISIRKKRAVDWIRRVSA
jgi:hypothetical protein